MADQRPPRVVGDERGTLHALFRYHRESVLAKLDGLTEEQARSSPVASGTSLLWLIKHLAFAETLWFRSRFLGDMTPASNVLEPSDTIASVSAAYRAAWAVSDAIVAANDLDTLTINTAPDSPVDLRWVLAHMLEETARHAGHADILRELIDGETGR